jgi:hypothetical protein
MKTYTLFSEISNIHANSASSSYFKVENLLVRVANHLPNTTNFEEYNDNQKNVLLVFTDTDLTEYEVEYLIYDEKYCNVDDIQKKIKRML